MFRRISPFLFSGLSPLLCMAQGLPGAEGGGGAASPPPNGGGQNAGPGQMENPPSPRPGSASTPSPQGQGSAPSYQQPQPAYQQQAPIPIERTPTRKMITADDEQLPDDADLYEISRSNFKKRLERHSKGQLKQAFGTDNIEEILAWKTQAQQASQREEEQRLSQMTEAERYRTQWEKAQSTSEHWKSQYEQLQEQHFVSEQDQKVMSLASRHVDPMCIDFVTMELAKHLQQVDEADLGTDHNLYVDNWVRGFVAQYPKFASSAMSNGNGQGQGGAQGQASNVLEYTAPGQQKANGQPQAAAPPPRQVQVPFHNGPSTQTRPNQGSQQQNPYNKTAAPGLPNSMDDNEFRRWKREQGYDF